jgi:WD40-like Beta Propeller Repeat
VRDLLLSATYALTTSGLPPGSAAVFSPDGSLIGYNYPSGQFNLRSVQSAAVVYSAVLGSPPARLAISPNNQLIAFLFSSTPFLRAIDHLANSNWQIATSLAPAERAGLRFSGDSRFLVYAAATAPNQPVQVLLYDFQTGASNLISQSFDGLNPGNADSDAPIISPDGRYIVYRSLATNLVAGSENNHSANIFKYDRMLGVTTLLTMSGSATGPANDRSFAPSLSANGGTLLIPSAASDLVARDFNQSSDLFADAEATYIWVVEKQPGQGPTLAWFAQPGQTYHVQYKTSLSDLQWQDSLDPVTVSGAGAQFTDNEPSPSQRFYRVIGF